MLANYTLVLSFFKSKTCRPPITQIYLSLPTCNCTFPATPARLVLSEVYPASTIDYLLIILVFVGHLINHC